MVAYTKVSESRRNFVKGAGAGLLGVAIAGCLGDDDSGDDDEGEEVVFFVQNTIPTLDPHRAADNVSYTSTINLYDPLMMPSEDDYTPEPWLAENVVAEDEATFLFELRDDVQFHSGNDLTADDVAYSVERYLSIGEGESGVWSGILEPEGLEVVDDQSIRFNLETAFAEFEATMVQMTIVDSEEVMSHEQDGDFGERGDFGTEWLQENAAGTGAYQLDQWEPGERLRFERFGDYFQGWGDDYFERAQMRIMEEESSLKIGIQQGDGDISHQYMEADAWEEMDGFDNVSVQETPQIQSWNGTFNTQVEPTSDINVRKAFTHAFDFDGMLNQVFDGAEAAIGPVPVVLNEHNGDLEPYTRDEEAAVEFLEASDYTADEIDEIGITIDYFEGFALYRNYSTLLQDNLREVLGIENVEVEGVPVSPLFERLTSPDTMAHICPVANTANIPSAYNYTYRMYHPSQFPEESGSVGYGNAARWTTDELAAILEDIQAETDPDIRHDLYLEAQEHIVEGYPAMFVANPLLRRAVRDDIGGWSFRGAQNFDMRFHSLYPQ